MVMLPLVVVVAAVVAVLMMAVLLVVVMSFATRDSSPVGPEKSSTALVRRSSSEAHQELIGRLTKEVEPISSISSSKRPSNAPRRRWRRCGSGMRLAMKGVNAHRSAFIGRTCTARTSPCSVASRARSSIPRAHKLVK